MKKVRLSPNCIWIRGVQGIDETYELKLIRKDGSPFWVLVSSKSLLDKDGKFAGSLSMLTDITETKKSRREN